MFEKIIREYWIDVCNFTLTLMQLITRAIKMICLCFVMHVILLLHNTASRRYCTMVWL
jgi:hypothetical protein